MREGLLNNMPRAFHNRASLVLPVWSVGIVRLMPWPDARGPSIARAHLDHARDLNRIAAHSVGRFEAFHAA
jgi:hypothetical protein